MHGRACLFSEYVSSLTWAFHFSGAPRCETGILHRWICILFYVKGCSRMIRCGRQMFGRRNLRSAENELMVFVSEQVIGFTARKNVRWNDHVSNRSSHRADRRDHFCDSQVGDKHSNAKYISKLSLWERCDNINYDKLEWPMLRYQLQVRSVNKYLVIFLPCFPFNYRHINIMCHDRTEIVFTHDLSHASFSSNFPGPSA